MGKHKRTRHRRGRKKDRPAAPAATSGPPLLWRLRHADPQTRLAALTALAQQTPSWDGALWQAVCEQVVVHRGASVAQLSIATVAATIMAEWASSNTNNSATIEAQNTLTAGWPLVLQGQLQTCLHAWQDQTQRHQLLWGQCAWQCWYAWTSLVEANPVVMDRLQQQPGLRNDALALLRDWLLITTTEKTSVGLDGDCKIWSDRIAETVARALHSLLQDNPGVVEPWWDESADNTGWLTTQIPFILENNVGSVVTRLHLSGVWMTCRAILSDVEALQSSQVLEHVVRTLQDCLVLPAMETKLEDWQDLYRKASEQTQDDLLERQVVRKQNERNEPARQIARRLAKDKGGEMKLDDDAEEGSDDMEDDGVLKPGQLPSERPDHAQNWDDTMQGWETALRPLELSLEICAHLTSVAPEDSVMMDNDDENFAVQSAVWDPVFKQHCQQLPARLFACFQTLHGSQWMLLPQPMALHWSELQSKASTGFGHCLVQLSRDDGVNSILNMSQSQLWQALWSAIRQTLATSSGRQAALGLVVVTLQTYPILRQEITPTELDFLISLLQSREESPAVVREAVVILGILCSQEQHTEPVNRSVCCALIDRLESVEESIVVRAEVLNALMDIYGNDDCHPCVFDNLKVLDHFERSVPLVKQQLSQANRQAVDSNDIDYWREIVLNATRFIEYKHEGL